MRIFLIVLFWLYAAGVLALFYCIWQLAVGDYPRERSRQDDALDLVLGVVLTVAFAYFIWWPK